MIADLLTKLEDEKDQWIYDAIDRFHERFMDLDGQWYETGEGPAENQIMNMKSSMYSIRKQKNLELKSKQMELKTIEASMTEDERTHENLETAIEFLDKELVLYADQLQGLEKVQLGKYQVFLDDKFTFDKKDQVVFKERKISKLVESYQMVEMELVDFYQRQLSTIWVLLSRSMENIDSAAKVDFKMDPPQVGLSLKHGRGLDQYIKLGNFEEDFRIVLETLIENNDIVYGYYESQVNQFKEKGIEDIKLLWTQKIEHKRQAEENLHELQEQRKINEKRMLELQDELGSEEIERNQELLEPKLLDDMLKEEFVKTVSRWQDKLFAENASDEERWVYHHYCQLILKQAERIIGNEYF
ncbi:hypothetical protein [Neobacillus sp. DY30]|uniref:hypothetical protein n=1 Tax=Neobacillus sp. DY30 TaxID=3047871 RepID=UPI0024BF450C|nr:hypothetical protein [Neobacillus sp. DY30]WHY00249.1 hypothetical protein QNH29_27595 [Neobacillus sp. DY30]